jgi:hypothetical protein
MRERNLDSKSLILVLAALTLFCCPWTSALGEDDAQALVHKNEACQNAIYRSPDFAPLRVHIPVDIYRTAPEQLADTNFVSDEEIHAISLTHPLAQVCWAEFLNELSKLNPSLAVIWTNRITKAQKSLIDLLQKKQSWGQHIRRSLDAALDGRAQFAAEAQRSVAGAYQSSQTESAPQLAAALAQFQETQQTIKGLNLR